MVYLLRRRINSRLTDITVIHVIDPYNRPFGWLLFGLLLLAQPLQRLKLDDPLVVLKKHPHSLLHLLVIRNHLLNIHGSVKLDSEVLGRVLVQKLLRVYWVLIAHLVEESGTRLVFARRFQNQFCAHFLSFAGSVNIDDDSLTTVTNRIVFHLLVICTRPSIMHDTFLVSTSRSHNWKMRSPNIKMKFLVVLVLMSKNRRDSTRSPILCLIVVN